MNLTSMTTLTARACLWYLDLVTTRSSHHKRVPYKVRSWGWRGRGSRSHMEGGKIYAPDYLPPSASALVQLGDKCSLLPYQYPPRLLQRLLPVTCASVRQQTALPCPYVRHLQHKSINTSSHDSHHPRPRSRLLGIGLHGHGQGPAQARDYPLLDDGT